MTSLPVTQMVLYKHGVGFFTREGQTDAGEVTLTFRHDEINDVLKSMVVLDHGPGQVLGIHYQTPKDHAARLADSSIRLSDRASLLDLLRDLRGRQVSLIFQATQVSGRVIGVDTDPEEPLADSLVTVVNEGNNVQVFRLGEVRGLNLLDDRAEHDLQFFLDTSTSDEIRRGVKLRLSASEKHDLLVSYVAPSPTWRVSYRLVAESNEDGQTGQALLQGWGLFDNRLEEDLENVQVTLVAGQPISFIYDLYSSRIPERPVIEDESRTAPGPVEFDARRAKRARREMPAAQAMAKAAPMPEAEAMDAFAGGREDVVQGLSMASAAVEPSAAGREAGEFFAYEVTTPVTVKRGESALVPIIGAQVDYNRELLYNGAKLPDHPVAAMRFTNTTALTLERGPVTVVEDGDYKGEAVVPFTKTDNEVYLAFAVELGIKVTERTSHRREMAGLDIRGEYLLINEYQVMTTVYTVDNTTGKAQTITIEASITTNQELFNTPDPDAETATVRRWEIPVDAHNEAEFVRTERRLLQRHEQLRGLKYRQLKKYFEDEWLDKDAYERLSGLLDQLAFIEEAQREQAELHDERQQIFERQAQLRENLKSLRAEGEEAALRGRMLEQLETTEDRLAAIDERIDDLEQQIERAEEEIERTLEALGG